MNVAATDKGTSKNAKITITNNKGRLSKEDIEKLIKDAEKYKDQDDLVRKKIEAKNGLESFLVNVKHSLNDEKLKDKFSADDKEAVNKKLTETQSWFDSNPDAETSEYERRQKEVEEIFNPIISKVYQAAGGQPGGPGAPGGFPGAGGPSGPAGGSGNTPKVDEVD